MEFRSDPTGTALIPVDEFLFPRVRNPQSNGPQEE
jgi:hypothetical protein